ncbi:hypothetical protein KIL84_004665 [Mauremys mutica]|uniref:Butyrophilin subfamily 3 member A2-like Ig-C domain-containing protein n=1 Tax=Mauremys mutica TaxID=74926 RepID=A0A9D3XPU4_9SAUR|nr:hypothetical protein KIL84_004665 [Mauremys mutica]
MTGKVPSFSPGSTVSSALPGYVALCLALQVHRLTSGLGSAPAISVEGHQDGGIRVVCRSAGWYPEPKAQWRDLQGKILLSDSAKISPEANGLFQAEIAIVLTEESNQKVSCCVRTLLLNQERESEISIAETLRSDLESEKEMLRSDLESEKDKLQAEFSKFHSPQYHPV